MDENVHFYFQKKFIFWDPLNPKISQNNLGSLYVDLSGMVKKYLRKS